MSESSRPKEPFFSNIIFWFVLMLLYIPLIVMMSGSLMDQNQLSFRWYQEVILDPELTEALMRSFGVAVVASSISVILGLCAAYSLKKTNFKLNRILEGLSVLSLVLPELVFALSLLAWFSFLHFELSLITVTIAHVTFCLAFSIFIISSRLVQLEPYLDEAAFDLGASFEKTFFTVILPLLKPALISAFVIGFLLSFDDFLITYFVNGVGTDTLPIRLYTGMKAGLTPKLNALSTMMTLISVCAVGVLKTLISRKS